MQNRYTGDIGDFGKLGLLRQLENAGFTIGVNWYMVPDENHNNDGGHINYLKSDAFRICDEPLWWRLGEIVNAGKRQVCALEEQLLQCATYYSAPVDFSDMDKQERDAFRENWHKRAVEKLGSCDIVFVDPDNGLIVPSAEGTPKSNKYVLEKELSAYFKAGASVIYYQHKARLPDEYYITLHEKLLNDEISTGATGVGLKFIRTSQRYFFFIIQPRHKAQIDAAVQNMLSSNWAHCFEVVL